MDTTQINDSIFDSGWTIYLIAFLVLLALYFVQKYAHLIDRKLNQFSGNDSNWEGKPWPLILGLLLGVFMLLFNVFSPVDMQWNPSNWQWGEWVLLLGFGTGLIILAIESIQHFEIRTAIFRLLLFTALMFGFFYAGLLAGLLIVAFLALFILVYFLLKWRNIMRIK